MSKYEDKIKRRCRINNEIKNFCARILRKLIYVGWDIKPLADNNEILTEYNKYLDTMGFTTRRLMQNKQIKTFPNFKLIKEPLGGKEIRCPKNYRFV